MLCPVRGTTAVHFQIVFHPIAGVLSRPNINLRLRVLPGFQSRSTVPQPEPIGQEFPDSVCVACFITVV